MILNGAHFKAENASVVAVEIISDPQPPDHGDSSTTIRRPVFLTEFKTVSRSQGTRVARSTKSADTLASAMASLATLTIFPSATTVTSLPS